jgi:DNA-binding CsgD family transcriptional regulator
VSNFDQIGPAKERRVALASSVSDRAVRVYVFSLRKRVANCGARLWFRAQCGMDCILGFSGFQSDCDIVEQLKKYASLTDREQSVAQLALTVREQRVAQLAAGGPSNKAIAFELGLIEGTAKVHMHSIFQKLDIRTRWALMASPIIG